MSTTTEQNKAVIRRFFEAWNSRRPEALDELAAPDVFPDSVQTIKHLVAEGNLVALWVTYEGTQRGSMGPFAPSGVRAQFDFGAVFRMEGGKIAEWWVTWDNMTVLRQLGHLPNA